MQTEIEKLNSGSLQWKEIGEGVFASHFTSMNQNPGYKSSQIYIKYFRAVNINQENPTTIFLLHDLGQHSGRFQSMINKIRKMNKNVSFLAMDFAGHGLSSGTRGHFEKIEDLVNDVFLFFQHFTKKKKNERFFLLGHGLGGVVALDFCNRFKHITDELIDGLIVSNFTMKFNSSLLLLDEKLSNSSNPLRKIISHLKPIRIMKGEDLLSQSEERLIYEHDPLVVHRPTLNSLRMFQLKMSTIYQDSYFLDKPILLLKSIEDPLLFHSGIEFFSKGVKKELLTQKSYSHIKHDLYNESGNDEVFNDLSEWIKKYEK